VGWGRRQNLVFSKILPFLSKPVFCRPSRAAVGARIVADSLARSPAEHFRHVENEQGTT